jgi:ubiquinone/menaquinone biosynthesis C-methylase UbiE/CheY-like chemotaxis protein
LRESEEAAFETISSTRTETETKAPKPVSTKPHVLIAAESGKRSALKNILEADFSVHAAAGAREAIALLERLPQIDALIIDRDLPRTDAPDLIRYFGEMVPRAEAVAKLLIAENGDGAPLPEALSGRMDEIYRQPFDAAEIHRRLRVLLARKSKEKRRTMRAASAGLREVVADIGFHGRAAVENISEDGMFVRTLLPRDYIHPIKIGLPGGETLLATGRVIRTDESGGGVAIQFLLLEEESRQALLRFIADTQIEKDLDNLRVKYPFLRRDGIVAFSDKSQIETLVGGAVRSGTEFTVIEAGQKIPTILRPVDFESWHFIRLAGENLDSKLKTSDSLFVSFQSGYATYTFETVVYRIAADGAALECLYPRILFYSEKRSTRRTLSDQALELEITLPAPFAKTIRGPVTDISEGGVSFSTGDKDIALLIGTPLASIRLIHEGRLIREVRGEIRNLTKVDDSEAGRIRYGVQFGIGRQAVQAAAMPVLGTAPDKPKTRDTEKFRTGPRRHSDLSELAQRPVHVLHMETSKGEEIVGLLNTSLALDRDPVPVIIIPPAFGKTKETLFALAQTIVENFYTRGKPVAVIRYDGVRRKGESFKDPDACDPPYEMVHASITQGAEDIKAVLDWLQLNPTLQASSVILVTFSLSALEARVLLRDETYRRRIGYWISCMGTMEFRELMNRVNCGLDLLEQFQIGIDLGIIPILGNLISMGPYASDVVRSRVATLDQARQDMAALDIPITWIYGEHDHWVKAEFVRDIMSVQSDAPREVISVPLGHNARTSEEALQLFATVAALSYKFIFRDGIRPVPPNKKDMEIMRRAEKDRIPVRKIENRRSYWQRYLVGEDKLIGFDVMALSNDYRQLMDDQRRALDLKADDRLLDLGGGTGNFLQHILDGGGPLPAHVTIADLIPSAMLQARRKLEDRHSILRQPGRFDLLTLDAELDHFLPVRRFLDGETGRFRALAERIENLPLQSAARIDEAYSPRLYRILRGELVTPELDLWLKGRFDLPEYRIILDFNLAARSIQGRTSGRPVFRKLSFGTDGARHLPFKTGSYNKILMSLVLSYIFNPVETLIELKRVLAPGGRLVLSTMRPDADASGLFTRLVEQIERRPSEDFPSERPKALILESIRAFLNDAQALVELEEAGTFDFFDPERLEGLLDEAGWEIMETRTSFGDPPQGYLVQARIREAHA